MGDMADDAFDAMLRQIEDGWEEEEGMGFQVFARRPPRYGRYPAPTPADAETRAARMDAHNQLDVLWEFGGMSRTEAYKLVQELMGLPPEKAHIGLFNKAQCEELIVKLKGGLAAWLES